MGSGLFVSTGEASGDAYAAALVRALRAAGGAPEALEAVGGAKIAAEGARMVADSSRWGAVGIVESLGVAPRVVRGYNRAKRALASGSPGLFVPVDFGYVNVRLARHARRLGWKVLYFIPPGSWRRDKQGGDIASVADVVVCPFPWSAEILRRAGADARFYGHPLLDLVPPASAGERGPEVAVLPGSRVHEVAANLPPALEAVRSLGLPAVVALARNLEPEDLGPAASAGDVRIVRDAYAALRSCSGAVVCSGTATLEAAVCGCPQVVVYRGSWAMRIEFRLRRPKFDYVSLPNILLRRAAVAELLQDEANPRRIAGELRDVLPGGAAHARQLADYAELGGLLGEPGCIARTAQDCLALLPGFRP